MNKKLKKLFAAVAAVLLCVCLLLPALPASAAGNGLLVLGDSITTGYALADYSASDPYKCASYANRLAAALGLEAKKTYINRAKDGATSADLLSLLPTIKTNVENAGIIVISIGGNDLMRLVTTIAQKVTGAQSGSVSEAFSSLLAAGSDAIIQAFGSVDVKKMIEDAIANYKKNVADAVALIRQTNPSVRLIFLAQYDPLSAVIDLLTGASSGSLPADIPGLSGGSGETTLPAVTETAGNAIGKVFDSLNAALSEACGNNAEIADVPSVINSLAVARTNILQYDIHPNAAGHGAIFELLSGMLGLNETTTAHVHEWGEWTIVSEGEIWEPYVASRECTKCGEKETAEFPARDTKPVETTAEETPETTVEEGPETSEEEATTEKKPVKVTISLGGCGGFAASAVAAVVPLAALALIKKKRTR